MSEQAPALEQRRSIDPLQAFQQAIPFQHQGRLWEVEQFYEIVLKANEHHFDAVCRFGLIRTRQGRFAGATHLFRRAVKVDKNSADAQLHLAVALTGLERHEDAVSPYENALAIRGSFPEAHNNLGHELGANGRGQCQC